MRGLLASVVLLLVCAAPGRAAAEDSVVLIVSSDSPVERLESIDVRKLFLGLSVIHGNRPLRALRNSTDERLNQIFLQNVVAMSEATFERRLLSMTLQQGSPRPIVYYSKPALLAAVAADPSAVTIAWAADVTGNHRIRVLRVLWRE
jgi:hypothetical protein